MSWLVALVLAVLGSLVAPAPASVRSDDGPQPRSVTARPFTPLESWLTGQPAVRRHVLVAAVPRGLVRCGVRLLGSEPSIRTRYVGILCGSFTTGPDAVETSGGYEAAAVTPGHVRFAANPSQEALADLMPAGVLATYYATEGTNAQLVERLRASVRDLPPTCLARDLTARQPGPGGGAGGTFWTKVMVTNEGADCTLTTGSLTLWAGGRRRARLDLIVQRDAVELPAAATYRLEALVPEVSCTPPVDSSTVLALGGMDARAPSVPISGSTVPAAYGTCPGVLLIGGARRAAPSP